MWTDIAHNISITRQENFAIEHCQAIAGGDINQNFKITGGNQSYFVKVNHAKNSKIFDSEIYALKTLKEQSDFHCPTVICMGRYKESSYLVLSHLEMTHPTDEDWFNCGAKLAHMHQNSIHGQFGWQEDNYIGLTRQPNN